MFRIQVLGVERCRRRNRSYRTSETGRYLTEDPILMYRNFDKSARCEEQVKLAEAVAIAADKVQEAQVGVDEAKEARLDTRASSALLQNVRKEGRQAVVALDEHKQEHQCRDTSA
jgi:hypothetical protein